MERLRWLVAVALATALSGCSVSTASYNDGTSAAGAVVGTLGAPAPAPVTAAPAYGAFLGGPVGSRLDPVDKVKAAQAEVDALGAGDRKTWRGTNGAFGFVAPASSVGADGCRAFTHTVYIGGRPQTGTGTGCRDSMGVWRTTG